MDFTEMMEQQAEEMSSSQRAAQRDDDAAWWDDAEACAEFEDWIDGKLDTVETIDEATGFVAPITRPIIPVECEPTGETQIYTEHGFFHIRTEEIETRARHEFEGWGRDYGYTMEQARAYVREYIRRSIEAALDPDRFCRMADTEAKQAARRAA